MNMECSIAEPTLGFLTVTENPQHGLFGGYLVLNLLGRPLEFHCTAPIKPTRAQRILYGPTLDEYVYGELIGRTLIEQSGASPLLVCTDREPVLATRRLVTSPLVMVLSEQPDSETQAGDEAQKTNRFDSAHGGGPELVVFRRGGNRLAVARQHVEDRRHVEERLAELDESFDLAEPFGRIREAIEEARRAAA